MDPLKQRVSLYRIFHMGFAVLFAGLAVLSVLRHDNPFFEINRAKLLAAALVAGAGLCGAAALWKRYGGVPRHEKAVVAGMLAAYFVLQVIVGLKLQVVPREGWDFPVVVSDAVALVLNGTPPDSYYAWFGNNAPLLWVYAGAFRVLHWFGVTDFMPGLVVLNCALINLSLAFFYGIARRLFGAKWALPALLLAFLYPPFLLYGPIAYTDTVTMPLAAGAVWLWLCSRRRYAEGRTKKSVGAAAAALSLVAVGAVLKVSVSILAVAFGIDLALFWKKSARWRVLAAGTLCFAVLFAGLTWASRAALPEYEEEPIPYTHWIMMGLHGRGGYYDPDYQATLAYETARERREFNLQQIRLRLEEMGPAGFAEHCAEKLAYIISDGTCYAPEKLNQGPRTPMILHQFVICGLRYSRFLYYYADALQLCLLAGCSVGAARAACQQKYRGAVLRVAVFGLLLFLLIWEARSRYLVNFLPLFLVCGMSGLFPELAAGQDA